MIDWNTVIGIAASMITGVMGWWVGKGKRRNDFLRELQESICMLSAENAKLLKELIEVRKVNSELLFKQQHIEQEVSMLRQENADLRAQVEALNEHLSNVKTITRKQ